MLILQLCQKNVTGVPVVAQQVKNLTSIKEGMGQIPGLAQWIKDLALCQTVAQVADAASIGPLAWKLPHATGVALKEKKKNVTENFKCLVLHNEVLQLSKGIQDTI